MKTLLHFLSLFFVFVFSPIVLSQVSNVLVNGSSTHFTMESGSEISWSYNLPVGGTAVLEIWIDVNSNASIEPGTDMLWQSFSQTDGQGSNDGPPDMDGVANGQIVFTQAVGLAPGEYIMSFNNNDATTTILGTITPLASPVFTITGNVTVPVGQSAQYLSIEIENSSENGDKFWDAITDESGNFSIFMDADTSGNPWRLRINNAEVFSPAIVSPNEIFLVLDAGAATNYTENNFIFIEAAAEINGTVKDEDGNPLINTDVYISGNNGNFSRNVQTDATGTFQIGLLAGELPTSNLWLGSGNSDDTSIVSAGVQLPTINSGNVLTKNLVIYSTNSTITGIVTLNGNPPNMNLEMYANVSDTGSVRTITDLDGNYTLHVSNKLFNYNVGTGQLPLNYYYYSIIAHPGQTDVNFNFTLTDVEQDQSAIPNEFSLMQNFPNPFNPSTVIKYTLPIRSMVSLTLYNVLGREVTTLVNEVKEAGKYDIDFNGSSLTSGVYFYRLQAGSFVQTRKMILLK